MSNYSLNDIVSWHVPSGLDLITELLENICRKMCSLYSLRRGVGRIEKSLVHILGLSERSSDLKSASDRGKSVGCKLDSLCASGKISARLQYALWALVLVRLLMPSGIFSMPFSVENLVGTIQSQPVVQDVITDLHEPGLSYDEAYEQAKNELLPNEPQPGQSSKPNGETAARINHRAGTLMQLATPSLIIETVLTGAWYLGIAVVAIVFLVSNIKFSITNK